MKIFSNILLIFLAFFIAGTLPIVEAGNFKINLQNSTTIDTFDRSF
jgi:hypothetical protein